MMINIIRLTVYLELLETLEMPWKLYRQEYVTTFEHVRKISQNSWSSLHQGKQFKLNCNFEVTLLQPALAVALHEGILIIFNRYVSKKISNWKLLYFYTSPNWCFYTTWWKTKPRNCILLLKCCMLFCQQTHKTH